jgi:broad specificity phosphatase PhoE
MNRRTALGVLAALLGAGTVRAQNAPVVVYLVRHAEKADDSRDPPLSDAGRARAGGLIHVLGTAGITKVWSTNYQRTMSTAAPLAANQHLDVTPYDPSKLAEFAALLRATPGRHLVVGHSNTTPELVRALGGDPGEVIPDWEYDRLYVVVIGPGGTTAMQLRYGAPSSGK